MKEGHKALSPGYSRWMTKNPSTAKKFMVLGLGFETCRMEAKASNPRMLKFHLSYRTEADNIWSTNHRL